MMNPSLPSLIQDIESARLSFLATLEDVSPAQARFKPSPTSWSLLEIAEHMVRAEQAGLAGMFRAIEGIQQDQAIWEGSSPSAGLSIEEIVANTWQPKEQVPAIAAPQWGGSLHYWKARLRLCTQLVEELIVALAELDPEQVVYPHPISGPMNVVQRLEFLRFHLDRHRSQIERVKAQPDYPH
ncbi:MAG: DinB family protein [Bacteroidota bacterium]